jgi:ABC-type Zn uptake system ZnuABC Zn-binding protein ZnuA
MKRLKALGFTALLVTQLIGIVAPARALSIVVTIHPLALLLEEIGGERVAVHVLVPPGASPHEFEPRPSDLIRVARADAFLKVGGGLDDWAGRLFATARSARRVSSLLGLLGREEEGEEEGGKHSARDAAHPHASRPHRGDDPHVWLDPILVREEIVPVLAALLIRLDPSGAAHYNDLAARFRSSLGKLDREIRSVLGVDTRHYVAFHSAWRHFAARYALEEIAVVQRMAGEEPTPRELGNLVREARRARLRAILVEPQLDPRLARTLSNEFGGATVLVDPLGDPEDPERSTYSGLLRFNARAFRLATTPGELETR